MTIQAAHDSTYRFDADEADKLAHSIQRSLDRLAEDLDNVVEMLDFARMHSADQLLGCPDWGFFILGYVSYRLEREQQAERRLQVALTGGDAEGAAEQGQSK